MQSKQPVQQSFQQFLQIPQNAQKYRHLHGLWRTRALEKRLSESSTAQQIRLELEGKVSYNSFDSNMELLDDFQNLKNRQWVYKSGKSHIS